MRERHSVGPPRAGGLPHDLKLQVEHAGYYPALVCDVLDVAVAGEEVRSHLVYPETTFDREEVRRHVTNDSTRVAGATCLLHGRVR